MNDRQTSQDLWHLTIDDLFAAPAETPRLEGDGPFVINLSTSTAPISIPPKSHISFDRMHVYQVTRTEEGRQRFRLRLGPISTQLEADAILAAVRERYPSAMPASAGDDDLRAIASATRIAQAARPARPVAKPTEPTAIALPPRVELVKTDESTETTGNRWDLDALLPHLSGPAPARAKRPQPKKAPVARAAAPAAPAVKPQPLATAQTPPPAVAPQPIAPAPVTQPSAPAAIAQPSAAAPIAQPTTSAPATQPTVAARPAPAKQVAKAPVQKAVNPPPVLTAPIAPRPKAAPAPTPPVLTAVVTRPKPAPAAPPAPPPVRQQAAAPVVAKPATHVVAEVVAATEVAEAAPLVVEKNIAVPVIQQSAPAAVEEHPEAVVAAPVAAAPVVSAPVVSAAVIDRAGAPGRAGVPPDSAPKTAASAPTTVKPLIVEVAVPPPVAPVARPPVVESPVAKKTVEVRPAPVPPTQARIDVPQMDPLETDWASILSAPVEEIASPPVRPIAVEPASARPPVAAVPVQAPPPAPAIEDSGLRRLVEKSNAMVESIDTPAADFSPTSTQTIEEKLAKLAELLDDGPKHSAPVPPSNVASAPATRVEEVKDPTADTDRVPVLSLPTTDVDIDIPLHDELEPGPGPAKRFWPEIERRAEPRPTLKSPTGVLSSIEEMVVVDEANNLENLVAKTSEPKIDATAPKDRVPIFTASVPAPAPVPSTVPSLKLEAELALETELTLAPAEPAPPPKLIEDLIVIESDSSLEVLVEKSNSLVDSLVRKSEAPAAIAPEAASPPVAKTPAPRPIADAPAVPVIVPTVVLDKAPQAEEPHVRTIVLDKAPQAQEPHVPTVVLAGAPAVVSADSAPAAAPRDPSPASAQAAPVVIRTRPTAFEQSVRNAAQLTARAAARAARKLRAAKHAAKQGAHTATPAAKPAAPAAQPAAPVAKVAAPAAKPAEPAASVPASKAPVPLLKGPEVPAKKSAPPAGSNARPATPPPVAPAAAAKSGQPNERKVEIRTEHSPSVDSTQTMRALTPLELADDQASKWFVIQLALSEDDFDPEHIPHLDIFDAYRLYAVIGLDKDRIMHALRLGFFSDEISAQAVHGYIKTHFESAAVKRVSIAERERFAERKVAARKDIGATGMHAIIEMASPKPVPETRLADLAASSGQRPAEEKSIWSRLVSPLKR